MEEKKGALGQTETAEAAEGAEQAAQKGFTRRQVVIGGVGIGLAGLIAGGALAKTPWHPTCAASPSRTRWTLSQTSARNSRAQRRSCMPAHRSRSRVG